VRAELVHLFGHGVGGRPVRILFGTHRHANQRRYDPALPQTTGRWRTHPARVRVLGVDDWAAQGSTYGTIFVDSVTAQVIDLLTGSFGGRDRGLAQAPSDIGSQPRSLPVRSPRATGRPRRKRVKSRPLHICKTAEAIQGAISRVVGPSRSPFIASDGDDDR